MFENMHVVAGRCLICFRKFPEICSTPNGFECRSAAYDRLRAQEQKVIEYLLEITDNQIGVGTEPILFLIASHAELRRRSEQSARNPDAIACGRCGMKFRDLDVNGDCFCGDGDKRAAEAAQSPQEGAAPCTTEVRFAQLRAEKKDG